VQTRREMRSSALVLFALATSALGACCSDDGERPPWERDGATAPSRTHDAAPDGAADAAPAFSPVAGEVDLQGSRATLSFGGVRVTPGGLARAWLEADLDGDSDADGDGDGDADCTIDADCDDGFACTEDRCVDNACVGVPIDSRCGDAPECQAAICAPSDLTAGADDAALRERRREVARAHDWGRIAESIADQIVRRVSTDRV